MSSLTFQDVHKRFNSVEVLRGISFEINAGQVLGLIGENGSGKSTCMNILGGVVPSTSGTMTLDGDVYEPSCVQDAAQAGIAFVHQELNLFANLTIEENLYIDGFPRMARWLPLIDRRRVRAKTRDLLDLIELPQHPKTKISQLSQGERQMVEIAKGLRADAKLMIFDEPTTSLTERECDRLFEIIERLRQRGLAVIYISHILEDVIRLADSIVVLRDGSVSAKCGASETSIEQLVHHMVGREISQLFPTRQRPAVQECSLRRASIPYDGRPRPSPLDSTDEDVHRTGILSSAARLGVSHLTRPGFVEDINLQIGEGEIVGLAGLMGSGRTELARILFGLDPFQSGEIAIAGRPLHRPTPKTCADAGMAFVTEDRRTEGLLLPARIRPNVAVASLADYSTAPFRMLDRKRLSADADASAHKAGLGHESPWGKLVRNLSGGNQQKVVLAKWLMRRPSVLILDEPTRGVDIGAKEEIYRSIVELAESGSAIFVIASETEELIGLCDRILVMNRGEISAEFTRPEFDTQRIMHAALWNREVATP